MKPMKKLFLISVLLGFTTFNFAEGRKMNEPFETDATMAQAIAVAYEDAKSSGLPLEKYKLVVIEEPGGYNVSWVAKDKPRGHRGSLPGTPEPTFLIEKSTGRVLQRGFSR
jgi:hypothetical protein